MLLFYGYISSRVNSLSTTIATRMDCIRATFEAGQKAAEEEVNDDILIKQLSKLDKKYRSVAYEGAAMARAVADLATGHSTPHYFLGFLQHSLAHAIQVHIGLGWALSSKKIIDRRILDIFTYVMRDRILDGYGYCDGTFRRRHTIEKQQIPFFIKETELQAYDQGVGRSLWYSSRAELEQLFKCIDLFATDRKPNLWRGIGIAIAYVGGCDENILHTIADYAAIYRLNLCTGAAQAQNSRAIAETHDLDTDYTYQTFHAFHTSYGS